MTKEIVKHRINGLFSFKGTNGRPKNFVSPSLEATYGDRRSYCQADIYSHWHQPRTKD
jgi:hypothetical protein